MLMIVRADLIEHSFFLISRMFIFVIVRFFFNMSLIPSIFENPHNEKPDLTISDYSFSVI
jgi:hypothetical protein